MEEAIPISNFSEGLKIGSMWTKRKKTIAIVAATVLFATVPAFVYLFTQMHDANNAFDTFSGALVSKNYESAYSLTTADFQAADGQISFRRSTDGALLKSRCAQKGSTRVVI